MLESNREIWRLRKLILKKWRLENPNKKGFSHFENIFDQLAKFRQGKKKTLLVKKNIKTNRDKQTRV
jgi:hypothetical protein